MHRILKLVLKMERVLGGHLITAHHRRTFSINTLNYARIAYLYTVSRLDKQKEGLVSRQTSPAINPARRYGKNDKESHPEDLIISKVLNQRPAGKGKIKDALEAKQRKFQREMEYVLEKRKVSLKNARKRMQEKGEVIIQDIKETKNKMREKIEEVIEKENVYTIPNLICVTRIGLSPLLGYLIVTQNFEYALTFMVVAGISDWVDGWVARNYKNQCSKIGSFLDPMADKVLIGTLFLSLTYVFLIPVALTALVIVRDIILVICGFIIRYRSLPPPRTISRYFDVSHATAQLAPTFVSKVNTGIQLVLVGTTLAAPVFGYVDHPFLHLMWYVTAGSTIASALSYVFSKKTYKYLKRKKQGTN